MSVKIQLRRDTALNWSTVNVILAQGELALETDTAKYKIGDGVLQWNSLPYGGPRGIFPIAASVEIAWDEDYPSNYSELTYAGTKLSRVDVWESSAKVTHVFSKVFTYDGGGALTRAVVTRELNGSKIQKDVTYSAGKIVSVNRTYSP